MYFYLCIMLYFIIYANVPYLGAPRFLTPFLSPSLLFNALILILCMFVHRTTVIWRENTPERLPC